nr:reverse transcriptase domain, reverse transcriptase zinc-binding domain protein [Tanacetum cinerariifolium]
MELAEALLHSELSSKVDNVSKEVHWSHYLVQKGIHLQGILSLGLSKRFLILMLNVIMILVAFIMDALEEFKQVSGLVLSIHKSTTFFCDVPDAIKASILNSMPFDEGFLPVRYLGEIKKGKAKVTWDSVCIAKHESGLEMMLAGDSASFSKLDPQSDLLFGTRLTMENLDLLGSIDGLMCVLLRTCFLIGILLDRVPLLLNHIDDVILWRDRDGVLQPFSVACSWDTIRTKANIINCYNVVWFPHCIPRHAIHIWLVLQQKLKTQDRPRQWDAGPSIDLNLLRCPLCDLVPDSHDHLFFEYAFSSQVWSKVRVLYSMDTIPPRLIDVTTSINPISKGKTMVSILSRLVLAATSYYLWLERNGCLFKKKTSSSDQIVDVILSMVRLKLVNLKFKKMSTGLVCYLTNGRFQDTILFMMGVP